MGISIALHALVLGVLLWTGLGRGVATTGEGTGAAALFGAGGGQEAALEPEDWDAACLADEALAAGARALSCFVPRPNAAPSRLACIAEAVGAYDIARNACRRLKPVDVALLEPKALVPEERLPETEPPVTDEDKEEAEKKDESEPKGQVVDIPRPAIEVAPEKADKVAEYDSKVDRETVSRGRPNPDAVSQPTPPPRPQKPVAKPVPPMPPTPPVPPQRMPPSERPRGPGALAMRDPTGTGAGRDHERPGGEPGGEPALDEDGYGPRRGVDGRAGSGSAAESPGGGDGRPLPNLADLRPSQQAIANAVGAGSIDYLKDVDEGAQTLLNTKRWRFAGFFNRVKRSVAQNWHPDVAYRLRDPSGRIYGYKSRLTVLKVSLQPNGALRDVLIEKPCGVDFLDDEAVQAFRAAQPFPNPPPGLIDRDSQTITFRFGFFFEIGDGGGLKIFRYSN